ncbi:MAG: hypothetical protein AAGD25_06870 [Cyanobacteria bacterium P01_F01_bin.150]
MFKPVITVSDGNGFKVDVMIPALIRQLALPTTFSDPEDTIDLRIARNAKTPVCNTSTTSDR